MAKNEDPPLGRTRAVEDFLKTLYLLQQEGRAVSTNQLSRALHIAPASTTDMIQRLAGVTKGGSDHPPLFSEPFVEYKPYHGVWLSTAGEKVALGVIRRQRLIELLLCRIFGYRWDEVDEDAELLEHAVSPRLEKRIAALLGYPEFDPHGDPIPTEAGTIPG